MKKSLTLFLGLLFLAPAIVQGEDASVENPLPKNKRPRIEVVFVLDTTGSMGRLIQGAKDKIWSIANEIIETEEAPDIRFGLIGYRDRGDKYVTKRYPLTNDLDDIHTKLTAFVAQGGGDGPESVNKALFESVTKMDWSDDRKVLKLIFLVGDAPPHMDYDETQYPEICQLALKKDLIVNTIQCGRMSGTREIWEQIAHSSEGQYAAILQSGGTIAINTPYDAEIAKLNGALNQTVCAYGDKKVQQEFQRKVSSQLSAKAESVADRASFFSKGRSGAELAGMGGAYCVVSGTDDLVEMIIEKKVKIDEIDEKKLPAELQKLSKDERVKVLQTRIKQRKAGQAKIDELVKKREAFIKTEKAKQAKSGQQEGFDLQVKSMIREQASKKGIRYSSSR